MGQNQQQENIGTRTPPKRTKRLYPQIDLGRYTLTADEYQWIIHPKTKSGKRGDPAYFSELQTALNYLLDRELHKTDSSSIADLYEHLLTTKVWLADHILPTLKDLKP